MSNIFFPNKSNNNLYIATLSKGKDIIASDVSVDYRKSSEERFFTEIGLDIDKAIFMNQVHKDNVVKIDSSNVSLYNRNNPVPDTDATITNLKNIPLVVQTADCLPIVLYCSYTKSIGVIHSGWRSTVLNIVSNTLSMMKKEYSVDISNMYAYIGAHIFKENYEVGDEVANLFRSKEFINNKWYVDNANEAKLQMIDFGLREDNIEVSNLNSFDEEFYSYRRDGSQIGRILTVAVIK